MHKWLVKHVDIFRFFLCAIMWCLFSGNHERDWPGTGSFYQNMDSGGECGVLAEITSSSFALHLIRTKTTYNMIQKKNYNINILITTCLNIGLSGKSNEFCKTRLHSRCLLKCTNIKRKKNPTKFLQECAVRLWPVCRESERRESVIFYVRDLFDRGISWVILLIK